MGPRCKIQIWLNFIQILVNSYFHLNFKNWIITPAGSIHQFRFHHARKRGLFYSYVAVVCYTYINLNYVSNKFHYISSHGKEGRHGGLNACYGLENTRGT